MRSKMSVGTTTMYLLFNILLTSTTNAALWPPGYSQAVLDNLFARQYSPAAAFPPQGLPPPVPTPLSPCEAPCGPAIPAPALQPPILPAPVPQIIGYYLVPFPAPGLPPAAYEPALPPPVSQIPPSAYPLPAYLAPNRFFVAAAAPLPQPLPAQLPPLPVPIRAPLPSIPPPVRGPAPVNFIPGISLKLFAPLIRPSLPPQQPLLDPCACLNEPICPCGNQGPPFLPQPPIPQPIQAGPPCPCAIGQPPIQPINCNCSPPQGLLPPLPQGPAINIPDFPPPLQSKFYSQFGARKSRDSLPENPAVAEETNVEQKEE